MLTRRQAILAAACAPLIWTPIGTSGVEIVVESDLLSEESASGFRRGGRVCLTRPVVVLAGASNRSRVREALAGGSIVIVEPGPRYPGTRIQPGRYVHYTWPRPLTIRSFGPALAMESGAGQPIAHSAGVPVAWRRGNLIVLGTMLGPHLFAGDREAHELWNALLVKCGGRSFSGTSTTT